MVAVWRQPRLYLYGRESPARLTLYLSDGSAPGDSCKEKKTITFRIHAPIVYQHDEGNNRRETGVAIPLVTPSHHKQKSEKKTTLPYTLFVEVLEKKGPEKNTGAFVPSQGSFGGPLSCKRPDPTER